MMIHMPKKMLDDLSEEADRRGCSMSQVVRDGLELVLDDHNPPYPHGADAHISLYLPDDVASSLRGVASRTGTRISDLVRAAIVREISKPE